MALTTYSELKTAMTNWLNRSDSTTVAAIPDFISLAEATLNRREEIRDEAHGTLTLDKEIVTLPEDFREKLKLTFDDGVRFGEIEVIPSEMLASKKASLGTTGFPRFAAVIENGLQVRLAPVPDQAYTVKVDYVATLTPLSSSVSTNWLLTSHPDIYLYASLIESAPWLKDDERIPVWESTLEKRIEELGGFRVRQRSGGNTPRIRPRRAIG